MFKSAALWPIWTVSLTWPGCIVRCNLQQKQLHVSVCGRQAFPPTADVGDDNTEQEAIFLLVLSALTFLNQLGEVDSLTVFNNGEKNEKILKVALPPEWLSGERNSTAMQFIVTKLAAPRLLLQREKN